LDDGTQILFYEAVVYMEVFAHEDHISVQGALLDERLNFGLQNAA
jgi:hypothetical protein